MAATMLAAVNPHVVACILGCAAGQQPSGVSGPSGLRGSRCGHSLKPLRVFNHGALAMDGWRTIANPSPRIYSREMANAGRRFTIAATPQEILAVMMDVEALPEWSSAHQSAVVLERDDKGRPLRSRSTMRNVGITDEQELEYSYPDNGFEWQLVSSRHLKRQDAVYTLTADGAQTHVLLHLDIEPSAPIPGFIMRLVVQAVVQTATEGLAKRVRIVQRRAVEGGGSPG
jgi:ribosome-associated toxin RatA of RatAB toxin-antitoxin module